MGELKTQPDAGDFEALRAANDDAESEEVLVRVEDISKLTVKKVRKALKKAGDKPVEMLGHEFENAKMALDIFDKAVKIVKKALRLQWGMGKNFLLGDLKENVQGLADEDGQVVSLRLMGGRRAADQNHTEIGEFIDEAALRMANTIVHELYHLGGKVENEAVVEFAARERTGFDGNNVEITGERALEYESYEKLLEAVCKDHAEVRRLTRIVYKMHMKYKGDKLAQKVSRLFVNRINKIKDEKEREEAMTAFKIVFWEFEHDVDTKKVVWGGRQTEGREEKYQDFIKQFLPEEVEQGPALEQRPAVEQQPSGPDRNADISPDYAWESGEPPLP